ncbi:MAG: hypothetical protein KME52_27895 [Desmonostoc geniculatum HA4340-LM1]|jgi:hypothetical protein|nr:hypothetical protein [Desmonostoc geniculatum HA4340-LM1]
MNKALARPSNPKNSVIVIQSLGRNPHRIVAASSPAKKILLETCNLAEIFQYANANSCHILKVEYDTEGRQQSNSFQQGIIKKHSDRKTKQVDSRFPEIEKIKSEERQHRVLVKKVKSAFRLNCLEDAERLLPCVDAILPDFKSSAMSGGINLNQIDWDDIEEKAGNAIIILEELGYL